MAKRLGHGNKRAEQEVRNARRAGLRPDERDPDEAPGPPGSAGGEANMSGTPGGGLAAGGMAGTNAPSGAIDDEIDELGDAYGVGIEDVSGDEEIGGGPPYAGPSGGAVGGTPSEKRAKGGRIARGQGIAPRSEHGGDRTIGSDAAARPRRREGKAGRRGADAAGPKDKSNK